MKADITLESDDGRECQFEVTIRMEIGLSSEHLCRR